MKRITIVVGVIVALPVAYLLAHWALIETGREVIVLRTEEPDGSWHLARLWIVDEGGVSWLHGANSRWMRNLRERPIVEVERGGQTRRYRAVAVPGPHPRVHELLRAKYGIADRWVRFIGRDDENAMPVRLESLGARPTPDAP
jgi:hypothetical protein